MQSLQLAIQGVWGSVSNGASFGALRSMAHTFFREDYGKCVSSMQLLRDVLGSADYLTYVFKKNFALFTAC